MKRKPVQQLNSERVLEFCWRKFVVWRQALREVWCSFESGFSWPERGQGSNCAFLVYNLGEGDSCSVAGVDLGWVHLVGVANTSTPPRVAGSCTKVLNRHQYRDDNTGKPCTRPSGEGIDQRSTWNPHQRNKRAETGLERGGCIHSCGRLFFYLLAENSNAMLRPFPHSPPSELVENVSTKWG